MAFESLIENALKTQYPDDENFEDLLYRRELKRDIIMGIENGSLSKVNVENHVDMIIKDFKVCEIASQNFKPLIERKQIKELLVNTSSYTTAYVCKKCSSTKSRVTYVQTRSSDEPMTAFIKCVDCNHLMRQ